MMFLPGVVLLLSVLAIGRDGRVLAWHGAAVALCLLANSAANPALLAAGAALTGGTASMLGLRLLEYQTPGRTTLVRGGALLLMLLGMTALPHNSGSFAMACGFGVVLAGLFATLMSADVVGQSAGLGCALNGMLLLAGLSARPQFVGVTMGLYAALLFAAYFLLRRIAWGRSDDDLI